MCQPVAGPFYRAAGLSYLRYANICADLMRSVMKEPFKSKALARQSIQFRSSVWADGKQGASGEACVMQHSLCFFPVRQQWLASSSVSKSSPYACKQSLSTAQLVLRFSQALKQQQEVQSADCCGKTKCFDANSVLIDTMCIRPVVLAALLTVGTPTVSGASAAFSSFAQWLLS